MKAAFDWTDAKLLRALALRDAGYSAAAIGLELGASRASVCGVLKRIRDDERAMGEVAA